MLAHFDDTLADGLHITQVAQRGLSEPRNHPTLCRHVAQTFRPGIELEQGLDDGCAVDGLRSKTTRLLFFGVTRFALMPDRQDQHDVLGRQPTILRDVAVLATRQHEFAPTIFRQSTQQRVIRKNLECRPYARELRQRPPGISFSHEI